MSLATFPSEIPFDSMMKLVADVKAKAWTAAAQEAAWSIGCTARYLEGQPNVFGEAEDVEPPTTLEGCCALIEGVAANQDEGFAATAPKWMLPTLRQILLLILQQIAQQIAQS